jgi:hypothetical protein
MLLNIYIGSIKSISKTKNQNLMKAQYKLYNTYRNLYYSSLILYELLFTNIKVNIFNLKFSILIMIHVNKVFLHFSFLCACVICQITIYKRNEKC